MEASEAEDEIEVEVQVGESVETVEV